jgi:hypothetical protein
MFDRTNAHHRLLVKGNVDLIADFSPDVLFYDEDGNLRVGISIAQSLGKKVVAYAEWAGGREAGLVNEAISYGVRTGSLPSAAASALGTSSSAHFQERRVRRAVLCELIQDDLLAGGAKEKSAQRRNQRSFGDGNGAVH